MTSVLALVLAGGEGSRLRPLTTHHAKPALVLADGYRIVDFVLSNLLNSRIEAISVLVQYKPSSLIEHIQRVWAPPDTSIQPCIHIVGPRSDRPQDAFRGTADAVYRTIDVIVRHRPDVVAVFAADHVYRMDVRQMIDFHLRQRADITVAAAPVPIERACNFGIMSIDASARICSFQEKPGQPVPMPHDPQRALASMGNYLFGVDALLRLLHETHQAGETDFARHLIPQALQRHAVFAYDFTQNRVPGRRSYEEPAYWRDIGTVEAFRAVQRDVSGPLPRFCLVNQAWPLRAVHSREIRQAVLDSAHAPAPAQVAL